MWEDTVSKIGKDVVKYKSLREVFKTVSDTRIPLSVIKESEEYKSFKTAYKNILGINISPREFDILTLLSERDHYSSEIFSYLNSFTGGGDLLQRMKKKGLVDDYWMKGKHYWKVKR